ncbi:MAG: tetratricopeptide repeat protein [Lachnospiraceae bacterium]|nr:tetratricopeptide repeat protein [Lachnospiraceae bacterium]
MSEVQKTEIFQIEQNAVEKSGTSWKSNGRKWGIIGGVALILIVLIIGFIIYNSPSKRLSRQLDLGNRYLEEQNYEQAIVEFDKAIAIDPMSVDAYLGKVQAYESMGDEEKAIEVLQTGYEITGDLRLKDYIDKLSIGSKEETQVREEIGNYNDERVEELQQFLDEELDYKRGDILWMCRGYVNPYFWGYYGEVLSDEQIEEICNPLVSAIEEYIELTSDEGVERYGGYLSWFYYVLREYDKCLEIRKQVYELTGDANYTPMEYTEEYDDSGVTFTYNQYGNIIDWTSKFDNGMTKDVYIYGDNGRLSRVERIENVDGVESEALQTYQYGNDGRLIEDTWYSTLGDGRWYTVERTYQYMGNKVVVHSHDDANYYEASDHYSEYEIDEYGKRTYMGDYNGNNE